MDQSELMMRFQVFEQQIRQIQEQIEAVDNGIMELRSLEFGLDDLKNPKDKEILAHYGKGIFVKAKIISEDLLVDVGDKNFVKKDTDGAKVLIVDQIKKLEQIKEELNETLEKTGEELNSFMINAQKQSSENSNKD